MGYGLFDLWSFDNPARLAMAFFVVLTITTGINIIDTSDKKFIYYIPINK
jgi:hypothetical protein